MSQHEPRATPPVGRRSHTPARTAPDGSDIRLLIDQRHGAVGSSLCEVTLAAGGISRPVWHRTVEEVWYVLSGHGRVWRSPAGEDTEPGQIVGVGHGDALAIPTGWRFQFSADAGGELRFLCYTSPPWPGPDEAVPADTGGLGDATV